MGGFEVFVTLFRTFQVSDCIVTLFVEQQPHLYFFFTIWKFSTFSSVVSFFFHVSFLVHIIRFFVRLC